MASPGPAAPPVAPEAPGEGGYIPARREEPPELSYFYRAPKTENVSTYDSLFKRMEGYNEHHHRCDRTHAKGHGLNINEEEMERPVAVLSSSEYGRRVNKPTEQPTKEYARFNYVQADFYNKNGITCLLEASSPSLDLC